MRVVILDDEEKILSLICTLINWKKLDMELSGTASDGINGLELIKKIKPDFLITDIRMPGKSGLQVIEEAKQLFPNLQVVLISGYSQFDYAQKAIRFGVVNYLLKPINKKELNETLLKMSLDYKKEQQILTHAEQIENQIKTIETEKKQKALLSLLLKDFSSLNEIGIIFPSELILIKIDCLKIPYDCKTFEVLKSRITNHISDLLKENFVCACYNSYILLAISKKEINDLFLEALLSWCKEQMELFKNFTFTLSTGCTVTNQNDYIKSIQLVLYGISERLKNGTLCIYKEKNICNQIDYDCSSYATAIVASMVQNNNETFLAAFNNFKTNLINANIPIFNFVNTINEFTNSILEEVRIRLEDSSFNEIENYSKIIEMSYSINSIWENIFYFLTKSFDIMQAEEKERFTRPIREATSYIQQNFSNTQLSLNSVAEHVGLNSNYFSSLFKKNCNINFQEYLQKIRLEKSKELLTKTKEAIKQISYDVGYSDPKYFAKIFKNTFGIKPNEYRQLYE